ncbi:MAG: glycosyltransferase family 2 protein, partial [Muribaculaceae bacterium]|nr:glycosyltransferase family 2 protein [Muribaculaceae bacterium]
MAHGNVLSVIILNWNGAKLLREFLPSVIANTKGPGVEVIVADNGSTDDSLSVMRDEFPDIRTMTFGENLGFSGGYNRAISNVESEFVVLLNSDVETPPGWWRPLLEFMSTNPEVGACQPKILSYKRKGYFEYAGAAGGLLDKLGYPYCRGRLFDRIEPDEGQYDSGPADIAWASGAALMVRRDVYLEAGGLDELFFAHMEEIDLCCRMHNLGYRVCVVPESHVYHLGGASLAQGNPKKTYLNFRNNLLLLHKNLPEKKGKRLLFRRRLMDTLAFFMFVAGFDFRNAKAVLKAHADFRKMKKNYATFPDRDILSGLPGADRCIVFDRYL